jgi:hypothetical protein
MHTKISCEELEWQRRQVKWTMRIKKNARKHTKNLSEQTFDDVRAYHYFIILYFQTQKYRAFIIDINLLYSRSYYKYKIFTL